jgi:hypothetical protein
MIGAWLASGVQPLGQIHRLTALIQILPCFQGEVAGRGELSNNIILLPTRVVPADLFKGILSPHSTSQDYKRSWA